MSIWVPGGRTAAAAARRSILSAGADVPPAYRGRLVLLLNEMVTNAIQHGGADADEGVRIRLSYSESSVRVEIADPGATESTHRVTSEGGWGLLLVDNLSDRWGLDSRPDGGSVAWFELSLGGAAAA